MYVYTHVFTRVHIYTYIHIGLTFSSASIIFRIARADASRAHPGSDSSDGVEGCVAASSGTDLEGTLSISEGTFSISLSLALGEEGTAALAPSLAERERRERGEGERHAGDGGGEEELWSVWTGEMRSKGWGGGGRGVFSSWRDEASLWSLESWCIRDRAVCSSVWLI